jgi:alpha-L-fucosidase 2
MVTKAHEHGMTMAQPATRWLDATPLGNGTIGALVYGNICHETVLLNHENLWLRKPKPVMPDVSHALPQLRELIREDRCQEAERFLADKLVEAGYPQTRNDSYHPALDLAVQMTTVGPFRDYLRSLDFSTGESVVAWRDDTGMYERKTIVSHADDALVMRIGGDMPVDAVISLAVHDPKDAPDIAFESSVEDAALCFVGTYADQSLYPDGGQFGAVARVTVVGEHAEHVVRDNEIHVTGADSILIVLKLFANEEASAAISRLRSALDTCEDDYVHLLDRHVSLHKDLFERSGLTFASPSGLTNEQLLADAYPGDVPTELIQRMYDFGRYLLLSSSGSGRLPANLQGIWNGDWDPKWESDYHNDENIQMNYWQALPGNMPEAMLPFFNYFESHMDDFRDNARKLFGCRGIVIPISMTTHGIVQIGGGLPPFVNWTSAAGWIAQHFYDYWLHTGDDAFLRHRAVPFMREIAWFYEDFLTVADDGTIEYVPSHSPENRPDRDGAALVQANATMDVAIARELLTNLISALEHLSEQDDTKPWRRILDGLPEYEINSDGALSEWLDPRFPDNYDHRHLSHLYPMFPGTEITEENNPALFSAARKAVDQRGSFGLASLSGWSYAHMANIYARFGAGDRAIECIELLTRSVVGPNLFTYHNDWRQQGLTVSWFDDLPPFQIDANLGITAALQEMIVFSTPDVINILPALPADWLRGSAHGLLCRGGTTVGVSWDMDSGSLQVDLLSQSDREVTLRFARSIKEISACMSEEAVEMSGTNNRAREVVLPTGKKVSVDITLDTR